MDNLKVYSKLFDNCNYSNYDSNYYDYSSKLKKKKRIIINSQNTPITYYFDLLKCYISSSEFLSYAKYTDEALTTFLLEMDKYNKLSAIKPDLLYVVSEIIYGPEAFLDTLRVILTPDHYKKENIYNYYYLKDYNLDNLRDENRKIFEKYIKKDIERIAFKNALLEDSPFYSVEEDVEDAVWNIIIYCFDKNPVVDKKELKEYLINLMNNPSDFFDGYYLNGVRYLDDAFPDCRTIEEKILFYHYIEHFYDSRNNYKRRAIR